MYIISLVDQRRRSPYVPLRSPSLLSARFLVQLLNAYPDPPPVTLKLLNHHPVETS